MRSFVTIVLLVFVLQLPSDAQNKWEILNEGFPTWSVESVDFIDDDTGWFTGPMPEGNGLFLTADGCRNWTLLNDQRGLRLIDIHDASIGWAITYGDSIMKTSDGGRNWHLQKAVNGLINELHVISDRIAYTIGNSVLKTVDGGLNWQNISPSTYADFSIACFINSDSGFVINNDNLIHRTINGGETWNTVEATEFSNISYVQSISDSISYFLARKGNDSKIQYICKTTNFFNTWTVLSATELPIQSCHFFDNDAIIATVNISDGDFPDSLNLVKSLDGGLTWKKIDSFIQIYRGGFNGIADKLVFTKNTGYYFFNGDFILKSDDRGEHWQCINIASDLLDLDFIDQNTGFIVGGYNRFHGAYGVLYMTKDGGKTWNHIYYAIYEGFASLDFVTQSRGYMVSYYIRPGQLYTTSDGGYSWSADTVLGDVHDMFFLNDSVGWLFSTYGGSWGPLNEKGLKVFQTKNQGNDWEIFPGFDSTYVDAGINSSYFLDGETGWIVGTLQGGSYPENYRNLLLKYEKEDGCVRMDPGTDLPLNKILFLDQDVGWISGGFGKWADDFVPLFMRTVDGGANWTKISGLDYLINDFYFESRDHGWAVGGDEEMRGVLLETSDGGLNWDIVGDKHNTWLNSIYFVDGYGWVVGDNGFILKYSPLGTDDELAVSKSKVGHMYNYPNPFTTSTTISYQLTTGGHTELHVYDMLGRRVTTPVKGLRHAGAYQVTWKPEGTQNGIYYCELRTSEGRLVTKMILTR